MNCEFFFPSPTTTIFFFIRRGDDLRTKMKKKSSLRLKLLVSTQSSSHDVRRLHDNEMCELLVEKSLMRVETSEKSEIRVTLKIALFMATIEKLNEKFDINLNN